MSAAGSGLRSWEYPKGSGIRIREIINTQGGEAFGGSFMVTLSAKVTGTVRNRRQFPSKSKAEDWAEKQLAGYQKQGHEFYKATDEERNEFSACLPKLREHGVTLTEAVEFALKRLRPKGGERTISAIALELIESKRTRFDRGDLRERSFRDFSHRASKFAQAFEETPAYDFTVDDLREWLIGLEVTPRTTQNYLAIISEILKYACQKKYIAFSPIEELTDTDRKELCGSGLNTKEPSILTTNQANRLLETAREHPELDLLGAITLGLFCGIRVEELKRLDWASVRDHEDDPIVTISGSIAKKRRIRHVSIPKNALKWLSLCTDRLSTVTRSEHYNDYQKRFQKLLKIAGFGHPEENGGWRSDWDTNAMRHSFGSYHYALHGNPLETARQLGHKASDQVLFDHYRALATKESGKAFFDIVPAKVESKVINFSG